MYSQEIIEHFADIVMQLGSVDRFNALPAKAVQEAMTHGDEVLAVLWDDYEIELPDLVGAYSVFDPGLNLLYTVDQPEEYTFGRDLRDEALVQKPPLEQYFYVHYDQRHPDDPSRLLERSLLVLVAHRHAKADVA